MCSVGTCWPEILTAINCISTANTNLYVQSNTTNDVIFIIRIKYETKLLYVKKEKINNELCKLHLKLAQEWGRCWYLIEESIIECLNKEMEQKYTKSDEKLKKTS